MRVGDVEIVTVMNNNVEKVRKIHRELFHFEFSNVSCEFMKVKGNYTLLTCGDEGDGALPKNTKELCTLRLLTKTSIFPRGL